LNLLTFNIFFMTDILRGVLKMCGIKNIKRFNCWSVPFVSD